MTVKDVEILTKIFDRLGNIDARLEAGSRRHDEFSRGLKKMDDRLDAVEDNAIIVKAMQPIVEDYKANKNRAAGIVIALTTIGAVVGAFASELRAAIFRH